MLRHLWLLFVLSATGCVTTPPFKVIPPKAAPRAVSQDCLTTCRVNSCTLPAWYNKATPDDQAALELNCAVVNADDAIQCAIRQACLAKFIKDTPIE